MTHPAFHTPICDFLGIRYPILQAGMGRAAGVDLCAAVSNAGGLGVLGCTGDEPEVIREKIRAVKKLTDKPFGLDVILPPKVTREVVSSNELLEQVPEEHLKFLETLREQFHIGTRPRPGAPEAKAAALGTGVEAQIDAMLDEGVPVFISGLGSPKFFMDRARAQGMKIMSIVGNVRAAKKVAADGVDAVIAQGYDGGGHTGRIGTFSLIPQVMDAVAPLPVLAAGGVADGRGIAAALAFGCQGVWIGTRFLACEEATVEDWRKQQIVEAHDESTTISRSYTGKTCRVIKNDWTRAWDKAPVEPLPMPLQMASIERTMRAAPEDGRFHMNPVGQAAGMLNDIPSATQIMEDLVRETEEILERMGSGVGVG